MCLRSEALVVSKDNGTGNFPTYNQSELNTYYYDFNER